MVIKGNARGQAIKLALHLTRTDTNERMFVREFRGVVAGNVIEALREMEAVATGARSKRPFYHASINTRHDELMTDQQKSRAIDRLEDELGLTGQPRVVVEHVKEGREHLHVAWCRIDGETMKAIPDSHNFRKHEIVARELEREFDHARVQGAHHERDGLERPERCPTHAEMQQADRSRITPEQSKASLRELWNASDTGKSFAAALEDAGWILAQGDRRGFVALDPTGEVRAINKDITGLTAAKVRERLADLDADRLPGVDDARDQVKARQRDRGHETVPEPEPSRDRDDTVREMEAIQQVRLAEADRDAAALDEENQPQNLQARPRQLEASRTAEPAKAPPRHDQAANEIRHALEALALTDPLRFAAAASAAREAVYRPNIPGYAPGQPEPSMPLEVERERSRTMGPTPAAPAPEPTRTPDRFVVLSVSASISIATPSQPAWEARREAQPVPGKELPRRPPEITRDSEIEPLAAVGIDPAPGLIMQAIAAVREMLRQLGDRMEQAFAPIRERFVSRQQPEPRLVEAHPLAFPELRPLPTRSAQDLERDQLRPNPVPEPTRQLEPGGRLTFAERKAEADRQRVEMQVPTRSIETPEADRHPEPEKHLTFAERKAEADRQRSKLHRSIEIDEEELRRRREQAGDQHRDRERHHRPILLDVLGFIRKHHHRRPEP